MWITENTHILELSSLTKKGLSSQDKYSSVGMVVSNLPFLQADRYESDCSYYTLNIKKPNRLNKQRKDFDDPTICKHVIPLN